MSLADVLAEVAEERARQDAKWGQQDHPMGGAEDIRGWTWQELGEGLEMQARAGLARAPSFASILAEEVGEALQVLDDAARLRAELVQVAAVAVQMVEVLDRRAASVPR